MADLVNAAEVAKDLGADEAFGSASDDDDVTADLLSSHLRAHARSLRAVLARSDVIIQVLDARDPQGSRGRAIEREIMTMAGEKKLVMVLNKIGA